MPKLATHTSHTTAAETAFSATVPATPAIAMSDAMDLTSLRLPQNFGAVAGVKKVVTTVPVRKPNNQTYVQVRAGSEWRLPVAVLQLKEDGECYLVVPSLAAELAQEVRAKELYTYITRDGHVALWPINLPGEDGRLDSWSQSAHTAAELAETSWVRLVANRPVGAYDVYQAPSINEVPSWPELSFKELLNLAFKDRLITSLDHPIVKRLRGEI